MATSKLQVYARHAVRSSRYSLSLSLSPLVLPRLVRSFRVRVPPVLYTRCRPRRVYTRKTPMEQACERILRVTTLVRAPLSATLLVECRDGVDTCSVQTIHPPPPPVREPRTERILAAGDTGIWASSELQRLVQARWNFVDRGFIRSRSFVVVVVPLCSKRQVANLSVLRLGTITTRDSSFFDKKKIKIFSALYFVRGRIFFFDIQIVFFSSRSNERKDRTHIVFGRMD